MRFLTLALLMTLAAPAMAQNSEIPSAPVPLGVQDPVAPVPGVETPRRGPRDARRGARNLTTEQRLARIDQRCAQAGDNQRRARFCQRWQGMSGAQRAEFVERAVQRAAQRRQRQPA